MFFDVIVLDETDPRKCKGQNEGIRSCMVRVSFRFTCHFQFLSPNEPFLLFYVSTWLARLKNHCPHLRDIELKTGRKILYLRFPRVLFSI